MPKHECKEVKTWRHCAPKERDCDPAPKCDRDDDDHCGRKLKKHHHKKHHGCR